MEGIVSFKPSEETLNKYRREIELLLEDMDKLTYLDDPKLINIRYFPDLYEKLINHYKSKNNKCILIHTSPKVLKKNKEIVLLSMYNEPSSLYYAELTHEEYDEIEDDVIKCQDNLRLITIKYYLTKESFLRKICIKNPYNFVYIDTQEYSKEFYNELKKLFIDAKLSIYMDNYSLVNYTFYRNKLMFDDIDIITNSINNTDSKYIDKLLKMLSRKSKIIESNKDLICNLLIKKGYIINLETPELFTKLKPLQVESIKRDSKSINFMPSINNDDVFNLILEYCPEQLFKTSIKYFDNELVKEKILNITSNEIYNLILESINKGIDINNLNKFIIVLAEKMYERERISSPEVFTNVYANTMTLLDQCNSSYDFELNWSIYHDGYLQNAYGSEYTRTVIKELIKDYYKHKNNNQSTSNELKEIAKICREFNDKYKQSAIKRNIRRIRDTLLKYNIVKVNKDGPKIRKLIKEKKQRELFFNQCQSNDKYKDILEEIRNKVKTNIKTDYVLKEDEIDEIIDNIFLNKELNITEPLRYQDLLTKIEIDKVINRLNNKNIDEYNKDYIKYKDYIKCKIINNKKVYYSDYFTFTKSELDDCNHFIAYQTVINLTNKYLMPYIKKIDVNIDELEYQILIKNIDIPFDNENVLFNIDILDNIEINDIVDFIKLLNIYKNKINDDDLYKLYNLLFNEDFLLISLFSSNIKDINNECLHSIYTLSDLIKNLQTIINLYKINDISLDNIRVLLKRSELLEYLSPLDYNILGEEIVNKTINNNAFNIGSFSNKDKLNRTLMLFLETISKNYFTVPRVKGNYLDYTYSIMEQDDPLLLTSGFLTDSCLRVGGNDNDFLNYCCLDKNGFIIKIVDKEGNFIGRAAGFRNGNGLFINQLRTIYDLSGTNSKHVPETMKRELINVLKACCDHIIDATSNSKEPIDFITITKSYTCTNLQYNAFGIEIDSIFESSLQTYTPIDIGTEDYQKFEQTKTLLKHGGFQTDYTSHYGLVCISSRYDYVEESLFKQYDPSVKYRRHRKLIETTKLTEDNFEYFNRLNNICNKVNGNNILLNKELIGKNIIHGTNWFIIYDENIIYSNYLNNDEIAIIEINETINNIKTKII